MTHRLDSEMRSGRRRYRCLPFAVLACLSCAIAKEPQKADAGYRSLRMTAQAHAGTAALTDAKFEFSCSTGKGGALQVAVILPTAESVGEFPFNEFEGPGGIGERKTLARWSVPEPTTAEYAGPISGWYGVDGDGFLFASSHESRAASDLARLLQRWLDAGGQPLMLTVTAPNGGATLEAKAEPGERLAKIRETLAPCLAQVRRH